LPILSHYEDSCTKEVKQIFVMRSFDSSFYIEKINRTEQPKDYRFFTIKIK